MVMTPHALADTAGPSSSMLGQAAQTVQQAAQQQLDQIPTGTIDGFWRNLEAQYGGYLPDIQGASLVSAVLQGSGPAWSQVVHGTLRYLLAELVDNARLLGSILILTVLAAVMRSVQTAFERQTISQAAYAVIFAVLLLLAVGSFTSAVASARHAIEGMNDFMLALVPVMVALLAASGALASAAFFQPLLIFCVHFVSNVVFLVVFPLIFFAAVLDLASVISSRYPLTRLASLLRTGGGALLGLCMSGFLGVAAVQGAGKGIADGVILRATKFALGTFVPVIGKAVADAAETVASASLLVKNAVGIAGIIIIACIALFPAIKILALSLVYGGSAALLQPLGETPIIQCLGVLSKSMVMIFATVAVIGLMFFLAICILLASANLAVMMG
ncbi:MAG: stage III sporulation protein AE [Thermoflavifilum sp.]|nr:stage III sporulation protein AE [Thermoflavifilum sp.]MCL6514006.1 stage III sporulation protein AE [Alicyclobacillus sp.]